MFERTEARRGARAVSFAVAAVAHGLLLLAALLLVRKQLPAEKPKEPRIIIPLGPAKTPQNRGASPGHETTPPRHRPRPVPKPVDLEHIKPPPPAQPAPVEEPETDLPPRTEDFSLEGPPASPSGPSGPVDCVGTGCGPAGTPIGTEVIDVRQPGVVRPRPLCDSTPAMPEQARIMGITGAVVMRYVVEPDGSVSGIQLRNSDAPPVLVEAVRTWLERCRFQPGLSGGRPAAIRIDQPFVFRLR